MSTLASGFKEIKKIRVLIQQFDIWWCVYRYWWYWLIVLVFYSAWVSPFEFGFVENPRGHLLAVDNVVNGFFGIDIVLTFFVAYLDPTTFLMVDEFKMIALRLVL